jgi:hypothetical protein
MAGALYNMEETYLYHKGEAVRLVNERISDPTLARGDECINLIAAMAWAEVRFTKKHDI